ncbi:MAG TPA: phospholipase D-like domain-containing protein, partial [Gammaproteobacteria bacterium]|nr:phospholipase D-like domain-containing protein [Gammaproteobacteria bacterium]
MQNGFEKLLFNEEYFSSLMNDIQQSKINIDFETYIFQVDEIGKSILDALCMAAKRGVQVRVLIDGVGTRNWDNQFTAQLQQSGAHLKI